MIDALLASGGGSGKKKGAAVFTRITKNFFVKTAAKSNFKQYLIF
jgi:hypothetical protein